MTKNQLATEERQEKYAGVKNFWTGKGFGSGFTIVEDESKQLSPISKGGYFAAGSFGTFCVVDPAEKIIAILMTQLAWSSADKIVDEFKALLYGAIR